MRGGNGQVELTRKATRTSTLRAQLADADLMFFTGGDVEHGMALIADRGLVPDPHRIVDEFGAEFERLLLLTVLGAAVSDVS